MLRILLVTSHFFLVASFAPQGLVARPMHALEPTVASKPAEDVLSSSNLFKRPEPSHPNIKSVQHAATLALPLGPINRILLSYPLFSAFVVCKFRSHRNISYSNS